MRRVSNPSTSRPLTRHEACTIANMQAVMCQIDDRPVELSLAVPRRRRSLLPNALLNLATQRILAERGANGTAAILYWLAELVASELGSLKASTPSR